MSLSPQELIEGLTQLFEELDVNASGSVSMDELVTGLDKLGYDIRIEGEGKCYVDGSAALGWVLQHGASCWVPPHAGDRVGKQKCIHILRAPHRARLPNPPPVVFQRWST